MAAGGNTYLARQQFAAGGVQWVGGDTSRCSRPAAYRLLGRLQEERLVHVTRGGKGRATLVKLTEAGDARARRLCALPDLAAGWSTLAEVARLTKRRGKPRYLTDSWIAEPLLAGLRTWKHPKGQKALRIELLCQEEMALCLLCAVAGWNRIRRMRRHVFYRVTCAGFEALATLMRHLPRSRRAATTRNAANLYYRQDQGKASPTSASPRRRAGVRLGNPFAVCNPRSSRR